MFASSIILYLVLTFLFIKNRKKKKIFEKFELVLYVLSISFEFISLNYVYHEIGRLLAVLFWTISSIQIEPPQTVDIQFGD